MQKQFVILDERGNWHGPSRLAAHARGYATHRITRGWEAPEGGLGFIRPHVIPSVLNDNKFDYCKMEQVLTMVQDPTQVEIYEDKSAQFWRFGKWMPQTWRFDRRDEALAFVENAPMPIVSKADVGASSVNVRIMVSRLGLKAHVNEAFGKGIVVDHCAGGGKNGQRTMSRQKGYVLLQEFIPNNSFTWRINRIGNRFAGFKRFNYPDKPVAQTGNVQPVMVMDDEAARVFAFAHAVTDELKTHWVALDILTRGDQCYMLEMSLAWPWPSPGKCDEAPFFDRAGSITDRNWAGMWDLMLDEYEAGVFDEKPVEAHV